MKGICNYFQMEHIAVSILNVQKYSVMFSFEILAEILYEGGMASTLFPRVDYRNRIKGAQNHIYPILSFPVSLAVSLKLLPFL